MMRVLIADDHAFIRDSLRLCLERSGLALEVVGEAQNGLEAENLIRRLVPDLVLTDIRMPGRDGLEVAARIAADLPQVRFIIITGFQEFEYARQALRVGAVDLITKPIRDEELVSLLRQMAGPSARDEEVASSGKLADAVVAYLHSHFAESLSLESVAEVFQVHPSHVSRLVSQASGESFVKLVNRLRLDEARRLLLDPRVRIKEVIERCGFHDYGHFLAQFRKQFGFSPSERR